VADASTSSKFFAALEHANVGVHLIAQASTERSISVVVDQPLAKRAIQVSVAFIVPRVTVLILPVGNRMANDRRCTPRSFNRSRPSLSVY